MSENYENLEYLRHVSRLEMRGAPVSDCCKWAVTEIERLTAIVGAQKSLIAEYELITDRSSYNDDEYDEDDDFYELEKAERAVEAAEKAREK